MINMIARCAANKPAGHCRIWKPRFDWFVINNENTLRQKIEYIHNNPIKKGLVEVPTEWVYSSARNYAGYCECKLKVDTEWESLGYGKLPSGKGS
jgi:hypothetical protein